MSQRLEAGPILTAFGVGVATLQVQPLNDRAAIVTNIRIHNVSATDDWTVNVGGREIWRFRNPLNGPQKMFGESEAFANNTHTLMSYMRERHGITLDIPVPNGQTFILASVGGSTADIAIEYKEVDPSDTPQSSVNHYLGGHFVMPVSFYRAAAVAAAGDIAFDTSARPAWVPDLFLGVEFPSGWAAKLLALWTVGRGVNTFSGAANHQSTSQYLYAIRNGQRMFSRMASGLLNVGVASAAGSANGTDQTDLPTYPSFLDVTKERSPLLDPPLGYGLGDVVTWYLHVSGDVTGGADYSNAVQHALIDLQRVS